MSEIYLMKRENKLLKWVWPRIPGTKRSNNLKWAIILVGNNWASFQEMLTRPDHLLLFIPTRSAKIQRIPVRKTSTPRKNLESFKCRAKNMFWFRKTTKRNQKKSFASIIFIFIFHHVFDFFFQNSWSGTGKYSKNCAQNRFSFLYLCIVCMVSLVTLWTCYTSWGTFRSRS